MGQRYADIVESCLTCLDKTNPDFGNEKEFMDEDGVLVWSIRTLNTKVIDKASLGRRTVYRKGLGILRCYQIKTELEQILSKLQEISI